MRFQSSINQSSIYQITANQMANELIVDFEIAQKGSSIFEEQSPSALSIVFSTNMNDIYLRNLHSNQLHLQMRP
jgi:hypothetical protein